MSNDELLSVDYRGKKLDIKAVETDYTYAFSVIRDQLIRIHLALKYRGMVKEDDFDKWLSKFSRGKLNLVISDCVGRGKVCDRDYYLDVQHGKITSVEHTDNDGFASQQWLFNSEDLFLVRKGTYDKNVLDYLQGKITYDEVRKVMHDRIAKLLVSNRQKINYSVGNSAIKALYRDLGYLANLPVGDDFYEQVYSGMRDLIHEWSYSDGTFLDLCEYLTMAGEFRGYAEYVAKKFHDTGCWEYPHFSENKYAHEKLSWQEANDHTFTGILLLNMIEFSGYKGYEDIYYDYLEVFGGELDYFKKVSPKAVALDMEDILGGFNISEIPEAKLTKYILRIGIWLAYDKDLFVKGAFYTGNDYLKLAKFFIRYNLSLKLFYKVCNSLQGYTFPKELTLIDASVDDLSLIYGSPYYFIVSDMEVATNGLVKSGKATFKASSLPRITKIVFTEDKLADMITNDGAYNARFRQVPKLFGYITHLAKHTDQITYYLPNIDGLWKVCAEDDSGKVADFLDALKELIHDKKLREFSELPDDYDM